MNNMTMGLWTTLLVTAAAGIGGTGLGGTLATLFRRDSGREASLLLSFAARKKGRSRVLAGCQK